MANKTSWAPPLFIEVPVPSQECERSCICVLELSILLFFGRRFDWILEMLRQCVFGFWFLFLFLFLFFAFVFVLFGLFLFLFFVLFVFGTIPLFLICRWRRINRWTLRSWNETLNFKCRHRLIWKMYNDRSFNWWGQFLYPIHCNNFDQFQFVDFPW